MRIVPEGGSAAEAAVAVTVAVAVEAGVAAEPAASSAKVGLSHVNTMGSRAVDSAVNCLPASLRSVENEPGAMNGTTGKYPLPAAMHPPVRNPSFQKSPMKMGLRNLLHR